MATFYPIEADINTTIANATPTDIIYLPDSVITTPIIIDNDCTVYGQSNTFLELTGLNIPIAININSNSEVAGIRISTDNIGLNIQNVNNVYNMNISYSSTGIYLDGVEDGDFEDIRITSSDVGLHLYNSRKNTFNEIEISECNMGLSLEGVSSVLGDTDTDPASTGPGDEIAEGDRTDRTHNNSFEEIIIHNNDIGIRFVNSNSNVFSNVKIYDNRNIGIQQTILSYSNSINGEIYSHDKYAARNTDKSGGLHELDMSSCWWGDITGPSGSGPGTGGKISNYIKYEPWLKTGTIPDLTYPKTRDWIWMMLGDPLVRVELTDEQISQDIEIALDKFMYYWTPEEHYEYFSIGTGQNEIMLPLTLTKEMIVEVTYQPHSDIFAQLSGSGESFFLTYYMQQSGGTFLTDFWISMAYKETFERTLGIVPSYEFLSHPQDQTLPYDPQTNPYRDFIRIYPKPDLNSYKVGVKVSRVLTEEEVDNDMWIRKYALTFAKEQLGRVRGKFSSVPGPTGEIGMNGGELIAEAQQEREALLLDLISRSEPLTFTTG
jgi:hypothetical protein